MEGLEQRPDLQQAIRDLMQPADALGTFAKIEVKDPDLARLVLEASVAALVNVQPVKAIAKELKRRAGLN